MSGYIHDPGVTITPGKRAPGETFPPLVSEMSDDAALFMLRREIHDLSAVARFTIEGEPVSKSRARFTKRGYKTQAYTPEKTHQAEQVVGWKFRAAARGHKLDPEATYGVMALFFCGTRQRRDVDNMLKLILDGLNKVAWPDDEQVTEVSAKKTLALPKDARTEVLIYRIGIVSRFTADCQQCGKRYRTYKCHETKGRKYCSTECANAARRIERPATMTTCAGCGTTFPSSTGRTFCSSDCRYANGRTTVTCDGCGEEFTKQKCHVRAKNFCTDKCRDAANCERRQKRACGTCETCGGPTSKKSYRQCLACNRAGTRVTGRPRAVDQPNEEEVVPA